jgi:O-acetyl-ADP-ribose deacetylase (regulator of RNase III)
MIHYVKGDATRPKGDGHRLILHVCNDVGGWGPKDYSFADALTRNLSPIPEQEYRRALPKLGEVQLVMIFTKLWVGNMVAQHGYKRPGNLVPLRYEALERCLETVASHYKDTKFTVHMPRIGAGLSGGDWHTIEGLIENTLCKAGLDVSVYDLP